MMRSQLPTLCVIVEHRVQLFPHIFLLRSTIPHKHKNMSEERDFWDLGFTYEMRTLIRSRLHEVLNSLFGTYGPAIVKNLTAIINRPDGSKPEMSTLHAELQLYLTNWKPIFENIDKDGSLVHDNFHRTYADFIAQRLYLSDRFRNHVINYLAKQRELDSLDSSKPWPQRMKEAVLWLETEQPKLLKIQELPPRVIVGVISNPRAVVAVRARSVPKPARTKGRPAKVKAQQLDNPAKKQKVAPVADKQPSTDADDESDDSISYASPGYPDSPVHVPEPPAPVPASPPRLPALTINLSNDSSVSSDSDPYDSAQNSSWGRHYTIPHNGENLFIWKSKGVHWTIMRRLHTIFRLPIGKEAVREDLTKRFNRSFRVVLKDDGLGQLDAEFALLIRMGLVTPTTYQIGVVDIDDVKAFLERRKVECPPFLNRFLAEEESHSSHEVK